MKEISEEATLHRLSYSTGLDTVQTVIQRICQIRHSTDVKEAMYLLRDWIEADRLKFWEVDSLPVLNDETGKTEMKRRQFVHTGLHKNGERLITNFDAMRRRADLLGDSLPPRIKQYLDRTAMMQYRANPELLKIMQDRKDSGKQMVPGYDNLEIRRFLQEMRCIEQSGKPNLFGQPCKMEIRRTRTYPIGANLTVQGDKSVCALIQSAHGTKVSGDSLEFVLDLMGDEYDLTLEKSHRIREAGSAFFDDPGKYGIDAPAKLLCDVWASAQALSQASRGEETHHLFRLDAKCSGYQIFGVLFGCLILCSYTCLTPGERKDFYRKILEGCQCPDIFGKWGSELFIRNLSKWFVMRVGYGASVNSLRKAILLHNVDSEFARTHMFDGDGDLTLRGIKALSGPNADKILNQDWGHIWKEMGGAPTEELPRGRWDIVQRGIKDLCEEFQSSIWAASPRLQQGVQKLRATAASCLNSGKLLEFTNFSGFQYKLFAALPNWEGGTKRWAFKLNGKKVDFYMPEIYNGASPSMIAPDVAHCAGDSPIQQESDLDFAEALGFNNPMSITGDIHDAMAALMEYVPLRKECTRGAYIKVLSTLPATYQHILSQGDEEDCGGDSFDVAANLREAQHFVG